MVATYELDTRLRPALSSHAAALQDLEVRLERGLALIEERKSAGQSVDHLEDHWIALLNEYQAVFDRAH